MGNALELQPKGTANVSAIVSPMAPTPPPSSDRIDLRTLFTTLRRRLGLFVGVVIVVVLLGIILTALQPRIYSTSAQVVLNLQKERFAPSGKDEQISEAAADAAETEVEVIKSRELAGSVSDALKLDSDRAFNPALQPHVGKLEHIAIALGLASLPAAPKIDRDAARDAAVSKLIANLAVLRVGLTDAIDIHYAADTPVYAQRIANEFARQYTQLYVDRKRSSNTEAASFLLHRLNELQVQAQADTARVQEYRIAHNLMSTSGASLTEQEISNYSQQVAAARTEAVADEARLSTARRQLHGGSNGDDVGESLNSPVVGALRARKAEVSGQVASLNARYGPRHPDVIKAQSELDDINEQIAAEINRGISNLAAKAQVSQQRLASLTGNLGGARSALAGNNRSMIGLDGLMRRADASQALYESYLVKYKERAAEAGTERPDSRILSLAELPGLPTSPRVLLNMLLALALGTGLGLASALMAELLFSGLTTSADVEARLGLLCLGSIPLLRSVLPGARQPMTAVVEEPGSAFVEAFRGLRTSLAYSVGARKQVVLITSALPKEGKTTISGCLARVSALSGERVVLVDVDYRRRGVSRMVQGTKGGAPDLVSYLRGEAPLDSVLIHDSLSGAYVLPILQVPTNLGNLLIGDSMAKLLEELRGRFDIVILDAPPILPIADTRALAAMVDTVVMVVHWRRTSDHATRAALNLLPHGHVPIAGVVLSAVDIRKQVKFGAGDAGYYYNEYKEYYT